MPTRIRPSRSPLSSGRKAHESANIRNGATIQFTIMLNPTWYQSSLVLKARCSVSYLTLHSMGYIIISKPMASFSVSTCMQYHHYRHLKSTHLSAPKRQRIVPFQEQDPSLIQNCPAKYLYKSAYVSQKKYSMNNVTIPIAIASNIHTARNRSSHPNPLNADTLSGTISFSICCLSTSSGNTDGTLVDVSSSVRVSVVVRVMLAGRFAIIRKIEAL